MEVSDTPTLEFDEYFQQAIVGLMIVDALFLRQCKAHIGPKSFADPHVSKIVDIIYKYDDQHKVPPKSEDELKVLINGCFYGDAFTAKKHHDKLITIQITREKFHPEVVRSNMSGWVKHLSIKRGLLTMKDLFNSQQYDKVEHNLKSLMNEVQNISFNKDIRFQITSLKDFYDRFDQTNDTLGCTIGHPEFDELLRYGAKIPNPINHELINTTRGGLLPGQTTIIMAPTNVGKTTTVLTIAAHNILMGKNVCVIGHESAEQEIVDKLFMSILGLTKDHLRSMVKDPNNCIDAFITDMLKKHFYYYHWVKVGNMYVEPVMDLILQQHNKLLTQTGRGFDLVIDDYPNKLKSKYYQGKDHNMVTYVYDQFVTLAKQEFFHCILPAQVNRAGYAINRGNGEKRMLDSGDAAGAYDLTQLADNIITLNRSEADLAARRLKFYLTKSRSSSTGVTFVSKVDYAMGRTHGWALSWKIFRDNEQCTDEACNLFFDPHLFGAERSNAHEILAKPKKTTEEALASIHARREQSMGVITLTPDAISEEPTLEQ